jgi:ABC-type molybdate transport system substrate-binding protein
MLIMSNLRVYSRAFYGVLVSAIVLLLVSCGQKKPQEFRILCGDSMARPGETLVGIFKAKQGCEVALDLGGSETLFPRVLTGAPADVFICHDPFEQKLKDTGFWSGSAQVGFLKPVLLVKPGNPLHITKVADLTNANVRLGIGEPQFSTCGEMFVKMLQENNLKEPVMKQVAVQARAHAELADGLMLGSLDAIVVWNFISRLYSNKVEVVNTTDNYNLASVTVVGLKQSPNPKLRDAFLELCRTEAVRKVFTENGYGK